MMAQQEDQSAPREEDLGEAQETESADDDPVPDLYEYIRDAPWQGPYGDPNGDLEPSADDGARGDPWAEPWPDQDWPEAPWPDDPWAGEAFPGDLLPEELETGEGPESGEGEE